MDYDTFNYLCKQKGTTPTALALKLGLSKGNTSSWKKGGNPSAEILIKLSDELNCTVDALLGKQKITTDYLSINERELLVFFNKLPDREQTKLISRAELLAEQYEEQQRERERNIEYVPLKRFYEKVSAGTGAFLSDDQFEIVDVEKNYETVRVDYIVDVTGDSMEPLYHNDDMLMVKEQHNLDIGEIGIFVINGSGYVKKFGGDRIISLNPEYDDILLSGNDSIYCLGKVLGVLDPKLTREYHETALSKA